MVNVCVAVAYFAPKYGGSGLVSVAHRRVEGMQPESGVKHGAVRLKPNPGKNEVFARLYEQPNVQAEINGTRYDVLTRVSSSVEEFNAMNKGNEWFATESGQTFSAGAAHRCMLKFTIAEDGTI
jgi:hypothetical protein